MRIGIDATDIDMDLYKGGIYHYIINLISHLKNVDDRNQYIVFFNYFLKHHRSNIEEAIQEIKGRNIKIKLSRCPRVLRKKLHLPVNLFIGPVDIFHGPFDKMPPAIGCRKIVTIHDMRYFDVFPLSSDLIPELADYHSGRGEYEDWNRFMNGMRQKVITAVNKTDYIITVSQYTKDLLVKYLSVDPDKIFVVHNGLSPDFTLIRDRGRLDQVMRSYGLENDFLLFVGHVDPLKNILRMIEAFNIVKTDKRLGKYNLVIITPTPKENWFCQIVLHKINALSLDQDIHLLHNLSDSELPYFYTRARALLLPSLYEGFGLPVIEAMACGTPVVVSNLCSLPEIAGENAVFINPYLSDSIAAGIHKILSDGRLRKELVYQGLKHAKSFDWNKTANETLKVYRHVQQAV